MSLTSSNNQEKFLPLQGLRVGISGAVPEREFWGDVLDLDQLILRFVSQLSALVIKYGGAIIHGSHPSFTPVLTTQAERFWRQDRNKQLTLVASRLFGDPPSIVANSLHIANVILSPVIGDGGEEHLRTRNDSLTALRLTMVNELDVVVSIGGKLHKSTGYNPGVLEELTVARWSAVPCFLVASYGGFTSEFEPEILQQFSIGNRLKEADLAPMSVWSDDVDTYVGRILEHLAKHRDEFMRDQTVSPRFKDSFFKMIMPGDERNLGYKTPSIDTREVRNFAERFAVVRDAFERRNVKALKELIKPDEK